VRSDPSAAPQITEAPPPLGFDAEEKIGLAEAARLPELLVNGKPRRRAQLVGWCRHGVHGMKLESRFIGCQLVTTAPAVRRFLAALNATSAPPRPKAEPWVKQALAEARI
jgi:hypothetical protein